MIRIALVGRPNVGKSALFNAICKKRIAIVDEQEGVTRDRLYAKAEFFSVPFELIDTGGINAKSLDQFQDEIIRQTEIAIEEADSIIQVVDVTCGATDLDLEVAKMLHQTKKPVTLAVNKVDSSRLQNGQFDFLSLGIPNIVNVSAEHHYQIAELIEAALKDLDPTSYEMDDITHERPVAIIGRTNVGKSTLLNAFTGENRSIVSPIAATTRDSIDSFVKHNDTEYCFIDTAGLRKKHKEKESVEKFAHIRTKNAIERAKVCLLVVDAQDGMTTEEKRIATMIEEAGKCLILLVNKWDITKGFRMEHCLQGLQQEVPFLCESPTCIISAKTGRNVDKIFALIERQIERYQTRITTGQLNKFLVNVMQSYHPPVLGGRRLRIYYMTQVKKEPPEFVLFVNDPKLLAPSYKRYLVNQLRKTFDLHGVPITFRMKKKPERKKDRARKIEHQVDRDFTYLMN